ncbi:hypothetical protein ACROYT_G014383 [Oculina patagonica]
MSTLQELKIDRGISTQREVRQWKKDLKATYVPLLEMKTKLSKVLEERERSKSQKAEEEKLRAKFEQEEKFRREIQQQEKELWEEKMTAELKLTETKIEMEKAAKAASAKLPELKITPFNGTSVDWIRFENMFTSQIDSKPLSDEEKYGYLLELVAPKVRDRLANLKPGTLGYKTAWGRLRTEFGQSKTVFAAHMEEIINLPVTRGSNYERVREFYEKLSKNFDALQTLGEGEMLKGFVLSTLNKLPQVKPDLVITDEGKNWEDAKDDNARTILYAAVENRNMTLVKTLVSAGVNVNVKEKCAATPLTLAVIRKDEEMCPFLLSNFAVYSDYFFSTIPSPHSIAIQLDMKVATDRDERVKSRTSVDTELCKIFCKAWRG